MQYSEKRRLVIASPAYRRQIRLFVLVFVVLALARCVLMLRWYLQSPSLFPGGAAGLLFSIGYWLIEAALLFSAVVLILRFAVPAVLTDAQLRRYGSTGGA